MAESSSGHSVPLLGASAAAAAATTTSTQGTMPPNFNPEPYSEGFFLSVSSRQLVVVLFNNLSCCAAGLFDLSDAL